MKRMLIVDDDPQFVESTRRLLEANGYRVLSAGSEAEGFEVAKREKPDLVIIDIMMETWSAGLDLLERLKGDPDTKDIPRILLSAVGIQSPLEPMSSPEALGVRSILQKPVKPDELLSAVRSALGES
ncbi:response regulator [Candidatus Bipolaricaulota bacterium]|nr:response regulator [Candidatus Bipolaricaulota bacterium]